MLEAAKWYLPQSSLGSFLFALIAHLMIYGLATLGFYLALWKAVPPKPDEIPIEYQMLNDVPPSDAKTPTTDTNVAKAPAAPKQEQEPDPDQKPDPEPPEPQEKPVDNAPKELKSEMKDESSSIASSGSSSSQVQRKVASESEGGTAGYVPYYRIKPKYPRAALASGMEGWILFKIDITESGEVENIRVMEGENRNTFQDEARRALYRWKYKPATKDGVVIKVIDHLVKIEFKLSDQ